MKQTGWRRFLRREDGGVLIETAFMVMILLVLAFGIVDLGRALYTTNSLVAAAREGARAAAANSQSGATLKGVARTAASAHFNPFGGAAIAATDPPIAVICIPTNDCSNPSGGSVRVTITYTFNWISPLPRLLGWTGAGATTKTLSAQAEYRYEQ